MQWAAEHNGWCCMMMSTHLHRSLHLRPCMGLHALIGTLRNWPPSQFHTIAQPGHSPLPCLPIASAWWSSACHPGKPSPSTFDLELPLPPLPCTMQPSASAATETAITTAATATALSSHHQHLATAATASPDHDLHHTHRAHEAGVMTSGSIEPTPSIGEPTLHSSHHPQSPMSSPDCSAVASEDDAASAERILRPKMGSRKSSGTLIVSREAATTMADPDFDENDVRTMSPRRNSEEVDKLGEEARKDLIEQAKVLQMSLQAIVDRVEAVKSEHEKLEGGNKFLQSYVVPAFTSCLEQCSLSPRYIGELMQTSKITSTAPSKTKGKGRSGK